MSEEQDSRTATVGKKRTLNNIPSYDLVSSSDDESDVEPVYKRVKKNSQAEQTNQRLESTNAGAQTEYISLLESSDSEAYQSAETGEISDVEPDHHAMGSGHANIKQESSYAHTPGDSITANDHAAIIVSEDQEDSEGDQEDSSEDQYASAEDESVEEDMPTTQDASATTAGRKRDTENSHAESAWWVSDDLATTALSDSREADRIATAEGRRININKLADHTTSNDVLKFLKGFEVVSIYMPISKAKKCVGFACVSLKTSSDATTAIGTLNKKDLLGRSVNVKLSSSAGFASRDAEKPARTGQNPQEAASGADNIALAAGTNEIPDAKIMMRPKEQISRAQKQLDDLCALYGPQYLDDVHDAERKLSKYNLHIPKDRRVFMIHGLQRLNIPEMAANTSPVLFTDVRFEEFIPLLVVANPDYAVKFLKSPYEVIDSFTSCVNALYQHIPLPTRMDLIKTAPLGTHAHDTKALICQQVTTAMASLMPEVLKDLAAKPRWGMKKKDNESKYTCAKAAVKRALQLLPPGKLRAPGTVNHLGDVSMSSAQGPLNAVAMRSPGENVLHETHGNQVSSVVNNRYVSEPESKPRQALDQDMQIDAHYPEAGHDEEQDDELQKRYFPQYDGSTSAPRCLSCCKTDHRTWQCSPITCNSCGLVEIHFTWACPQTVCCERCREQGHRIAECPQRLARSRDEPIQCNVCNLPGHIETSCGKLWRSFEPSMEARKVSGLVIGCFACGSSAHLGVDCGLRSRHQQLESSTFSMHEAQQYNDPYSNDRSLSAGKDYSIKANPKKRKDFSIKGRAKNDPINLDSDSDSGEFLRPAAKKNKSVQGKIQISGNASFGQFQNSPPPNIHRDRAHLVRQPQYDDRREAGPIYTSHRDEEDRSYDRPDRGYRDDGYDGRRGLDRQDAQPRYQNGNDLENYYHQPQNLPQDRDGVSTGIPFRGGGPSRGGNNNRGSRGGGHAARGGNAHRGGGDNHKRGGGRGGKARRGKDNARGRGR